MARRRERTRRGARTASGSRRPTAPTRSTLLERQAAARLAELVPVRYGRMLASPFAFYRGAAPLMAADLAETPRTGLRVQLCGDAHLANFGAFASPERRLVFDVNDFDETLPGPGSGTSSGWPRASPIAGRHRGLRAGRAARGREVRRAPYREAMRDVRGLRTSTSGTPASTSRTCWRGASERDADSSSPARRSQCRGACPARRTASRPFAKLTQRGRRRLRIVSDPPLLVPLARALPDETAASLQDLFAPPGRPATRRPCPPTGAHLLERYRFVDMAPQGRRRGQRRHPRPGSSCSRAATAADPLFLQAKEAERVGARGAPGPQPVRQPRASASWRASGSCRRRSDIFLGWQRDRARRRDARLLRAPAAGLEGLGRPRDAWTRRLGLLRAAVRRGPWPGPTPAPATAIAIAAYLGARRRLRPGRSPRFAEAYADQNERDYAALAAAVREGRVSADTSA